MIVVKELAKIFIKMSVHLGYKGKKRDAAAFNFFHGAAAAAALLNQEIKYCQLQGAVTLVETQGYYGVIEIANGHF